MLKSNILSLVQKYGDHFLVRYEREGAKAFRESLDMREFFDGITGSGGQYGLPRFNDVQSRFIYDRKPCKLFRAARRTGKSYAGAAAAMSFVMTPHTRGWIVGPTYELAGMEFDYVFQFYRAAQNKYGLPPLKKYRQNESTGDLYMLTEWGSEVIGKSADKQNQLVGTELDWVIMSEAAMHREETYTKYVMPTLMTRGGHTIIPSTPDAASTWLYELEVRAYSEPDSWSVYHCTAAESGHIPGDAIESQKRMMSEAEFEEQINGEWRFNRGRVHKFDRDLHAIGSFPVPASWNVCSGIDFGGNRDHTASEYLARSTEGDFYFVGEYYKNNASTNQHTSAIGELEREMGRPPSVRVADYHALGRQLMIDWAANGIRSIPCTNERAVRRSRFSAKLECDPGHIPYHAREFGLPERDRGYPRLFVFRDKCPNLVRELMFLRWRGNEGGYSGRQASSNDTIGDDHAVSAAEYVLHYMTQPERDILFGRGRLHGRKPPPITAFH